ncbi:MAG: hypothetical protein AAGA23_11650 [Pseudomonadota bacterium]
MRYRQSRVLGASLTAAGLTLGGMCAWVLIQFKQFGAVEIVFAGVLLLTLFPALLAAGVSVWRFQLTLGKEELLLESLASMRVPYRRIVNVEKRWRGGLTGGHYLALEVQEQGPLEIQLPLIGQGNLEEAMRTRVERARSQSTET